MQLESKANLIVVIVSFVFGANIICDYNYCRIHHGTLFVWSNWNGN